MQMSDITTSMQSILLHHQRGYTLWNGFTTTEDKIEKLREKWALELGILEPSWKRNDRKNKGIPNAVAVFGRVFSQPSKCEVVLMATSHARQMIPNSPYHPFLRQQWRDDLPRFSHFEMAHMPTEAQGKLTWTWKIRKPELGQMEKYLIQLCDQRDVESLKRETHGFVKTYPMYNGIRSQLRRVLRHVQRKCKACHISYPGPVPDNLPMMLRFPKTKSAEGALLGAPAP